VAKFFKAARTAFGALFPVKDSRWSYASRNLAELAFSGRYSKWTTYIPSTALMIPLLISSYSSRFRATNPGSRNIWPSRYLCTSSLLARISSAVFPPNSFSILDVGREVVKLFSPHVTGRLKIPDRNLCQQLSEI
jgi:hypothetical protein